MKFTSSRVFKPEGTSTSKEVFSSSRYRNTTVWLKALHKTDRPDTPFKSVRVFQKLMSCLKARKSKTSWKKKWICFFNLKSKMNPILSLSLRFSTQISEHTCVEATTTVNNKRIILVSSKMPFISSKSFSEKPKDFSDIMEVSMWSKNLQNRKFYKSFEIMVWNVKENLEIKLISSLLRPHLIFPNDVGAYIRVMSTFSFSGVTSSRSLIRVAMKLCWRGGKYSRRELILYWTIIHTDKKVPWKLNKTRGLMGKTYINIWCISGGRLNFGRFTWVAIILTATFLFIWFTLTFFAVICGLSFLSLS